MQRVVMQKKPVVAQAKADCEELLVEIVQDKRVADEQEKQARVQAGTAQVILLHMGTFALTDSAAPFVDLQVNSEATKIAKETDEANAIATQVTAELDKALPALREAEAALNVLTKKDISELKVCRRL